MAEVPETLLKTSPDNSFFIPATISTRMYQVGAATKSSTTERHSNVAHNVFVNQAVLLSCTSTTRTHLCHYGANESFFSKSCEFAYFLFTTSPPCEHHVLFIYLRIRSINYQSSSGATSCSEAKFPADLLLSPAATLDAFGFPHLVMDLLDLGLLHTMELSNLVHLLKPLGVGFPIH